MDLYIQAMPVGTYRVQSPKIVYCLRSCRYHSVLFIALVTIGGQFDLHCQVNMLLNVHTEKLWGLLGTGLHC